MQFGFVDFFGNDSNYAKLHLSGDSPVRGNVCEADKRVPVFGEKAGLP